MIWKNKRFNSQNITIFLAMSTFVVILVGGTIRFGSVSSFLAVLSGQHLIVDNSTRNFGRIRPDQSKTVIYRIENLEVRPISIIGAESTCACVIATDLPMTIPSLAAREIRVDVKAGPKRGEIKESLTLFTDAPHRPALRLEVVGHVDRGETTSRSRTQGE